jgi:cell division protein FtsI/penicillin-binding protein 2
MRLGFGQGAFDDVTPVQVAASMAALATRFYQPPTLIERLGEEHPQVKVAQPLVITPAAYDDVVEAMRRVTQGNGTAGPSDEFGLDLSAYDFASKTGTPQHGGGKADHSWFVGFFPAHRPHYAFAVFLEHTGAHGGEVCAPLLQEILRHPAFAEVEQFAYGAAP